VAEEVDGAMIARPMRGIRPLLGALAVASAAYCTVAHASDTPALVNVIELRQTDASLRETYAKGKRMGLPRMVMFDDQGRVIYGARGFRDDLPRQLHEALKKDRPIATPITLDAVLAEVEDANGNALVVSDLPKADVYLVDYWADWCQPCRQMSHALDGALKHWEGVHSVWLKIESDPQKLPEQRKK
jgi:hypothetical protein